MDSELLVLGPIEVKPETFEPKDGSKTILIFGSSGVGKSSIINLLARKNLLMTGNGGTKGCTTDVSIVTDIIDREIIYNIVDTVGLNESNNGTVNSALALENLLGITETLISGVSLAIMVRQKGSLKQHEASNVGIFYKSLINGCVPLVIVETGFDLEDDDTILSMESEARTDLNRRIGSRDVVCVCTKKPSEVKESMRHLTRISNNDAADKIWRLITDYSVERVKFNGSNDNWVTAWDIINVSMGWPFRSARYSSYKRLIADTGISDEVSARISDRFTAKAAIGWLKSIGDWTAPSWFDGWIRYIRDSYGV